MLYGHECVCLFPNGGHLQARVEQSEDLLLVELGDVNDGDLDLLLETQQVGGETKKGLGYIHAALDHSGALEGTTEVVVDVLL